MELLSSLNFTEILILILIGLLFFKETLLTWFGEKFGVEKEEVTPLWASQLMTYFNHDTTGHHEKTHEKLDKLTDLVRDSNSLLKDFDKYGVKCRE